MKAKRESESERTRFAVPSASSMLLTEQLVGDGHAHIPCCESRCPRPEMPRTHPQEEDAQCILAPRAQTGGPLQKRVFPSASFPLPYNPNPILCRTSPPLVAQTPSAQFSSQVCTTPHTKKDPTRIETGKTFTQARSSGVVDVVQDYTGWMWGRWFNQREMARLSLGPFLAEVRRTEQSRRCWWPVRQLRRKVFFILLLLILALCSSYHQSVVTMGIPTPTPRKNMFRKRHVRRPAKACAEPLTLVGAETKQYNIRSNCRLCSLVLASRRTARALLSVLSSESLSGWERERVSKKHSCMTPAPPLFRGH